MQNKLKDFISLVLAEMPAKTRVNFDVGVKVNKAGELCVDMPYGTNKVKFSITKLEDKSL